MKMVRHTCGSLILAGALLLLGRSGLVLARSPAPMDDQPPTVQSIPTGVTTTTVKITGFPPGTPPGTPPGGHTQSAPEPATLLSSLLGAGLLGLYGRCRRRNVTEHSETCV